MELRPIKHKHLLKFQPGDKAGCYTVIRALGAKHFRRGVSVVFEVRCNCGDVSQRDRQTLGKEPETCPKCGPKGTAPSWQYGHPLQGRWRSMITRCHSPTSKDWANYGGRGIEVCQDWRTGRDGKTGFECFLEDMGDCPPKHTLDRIDNDRGYGPDNCRWATQREQDANMRTTLKATWRGETKTLKEWARNTGIAYPTLLKRIRSGWTVEDSLTRAVRPH